MRWYSDSSTHSWAGFTDVVPAGWISGTVTVALRFTGSSYGPNQWGVAYACETGNIADPPVLSSMYPTNSITTTNNNFQIESVVLPLSGCTAGDSIIFQIKRVDPNGYANLFGASVSYVTP
jgi:hypothetical protein